MRPDRLYCLGDLVGYGAFPDEVTECIASRGIPTVILYKGGQAQAQKVGALSKSQLTAFLDSHL